ncbi:unnamed protein product [Didymodactylos carnosus]|uniref:Uncharacterized protein n=1 Tax=Didymodactylos carnosus TaxID=1234261 RepID=A0A814VWX7_9BILA|nr:unnamed protein product [Didymodactylos carnosus]CAF3958110.1 unnamed protein product [Didymodactylos carnosus]
MKPSEKYRNILQENIKAGAEIKFDLQWILNQNEISIFNGYKRVGANKDILFYGMLPLLSRFAQASIYASMFEESKPLNLYSITIGPPGSGKSPNLKHLMTAATKVTKIFKHDYMKNIPRDAGHIQLQNTVTHSPNGLALLELLAVGDVCIVNDEIDNIFVKWGIYNEELTEEVSILRSLFDGTDGLFQSTSLRRIETNEARLSILGGTTGTHLANVLKSWSNGDSQDSLFSRMMFLPVWYKATRLNELKFNSAHAGIPSFIHVFLVCHLFGSVEYRFDTIDESHISTTAGTRAGESVDSNSAYDYVVNKVADQTEVLLHAQCKDLPPHIASFYAKVNDVYPRICVLLKLYKNIMSVLTELQNIIDFDDDFQENAVDTRKFIAAAAKVLNQLFLSTAEQSEKSGMPVLYIDKKTCEQAWKYYLFIFNAIKSIFNIDTITSVNDTRCEQLLVNPAYCKRILSFPYTFFSTTMIAGYDRHDVRKCGPFKTHPERLHECGQALIDDGLLFREKFITTCETAYHKVPPPTACTPRSYEEIDMELKLNKWGMTLLEYREIHQKSCSVKKLTDLASKFMVKRYKQYYQDFPKYINNECVRQDVDTLVQDGLLVQELINGRLTFSLKVTNQVSPDNNSLQTFFPNKNNKPPSTQETTATSNNQVTTLSNTETLLQQQPMNSLSRQPITATQESSLNYTTIQSPELNITTILSKRTVDPSSQNSVTMFQSSLIPSSDSLSLSEWNQSSQVPQELVTWSDTTVKQNDNITQSKFVVAAQTNINANEEQHTSLIMIANGQKEKVDHIHNAQLNDTVNSVDELDAYQLIDISNSPTIIANQPTLTINVEEQLLEVMDDNEQVFAKQSTDKSNQAQSVIDDKNNNRKRKEELNEAEIHNVYNKILVLRSPIISTRDIANSSTWADTNLGIIGKFKFQIQTNWEVE